MKDAFGGSFVLRIMLVFFVVFICFMTASITISKTFRIKNNIINILERSDPNSYSSSTRDRIDSYLSKVSYNYGSNENVVDDCRGTSISGTDSVDLTDYGACIVTHNSGDRVYYKVTAYVVVDFPLFHIGTVIPVSGETKIIYLDR